MSQNPPHTTMTPLPPPPPPPTTASPPPSDLLRRITRDLPNLSDCHGCRVRINHTDPNDRLQTLDSVWRIVLLCKKCTKRISSGQTCPYCFTPTTPNNTCDCLQCRTCKRRVHKDCVDRYRNIPPWCYSFREQQNEFFVCIDCWVPRFFRKYNVVCKNTQYTQNCAEKVVKDAKVEAKKKALVALRAKDRTMRKAVVAKNAVELAKNALELVAKNGNEEGLVRNSSTSSDDAALAEAVKDAELAFRLHRAMNSSPRISKTVCVTNLSYLDGRPEFWESSNDASCKSLDFGRVGSSGRGERVKVYCRTRFKKKVGRSASERSRCVIVYSRTRFKGKNGRTSPLPRVRVYSRTRWKGKVEQTSLEAPPHVTVNENGQSGSETLPCVDSGCAEPVLVTYKRSRLRRRMCEERVESSDIFVKENSLVDDFGRCCCLQVPKQEGSEDNSHLQGVDSSDIFVKENSLVDDLGRFSLLQVPKQEGSEHNLHLQGASTLCPTSSGGDNAIEGEIFSKVTTQAESCDVRGDRFLLKYSKRKKCFQPGSHIENTCPHPTQGPSITRNSSVESRTSSNG